LVVRAAGAGMAEAEVALAEMMLNGRSGRRDPFTARALLRKPPRVTMSVLCPRCTAPERIAKSYSDLADAAGPDLWRLHLGTFVDP